MAVGMVAALAGGAFADQISNNLDSSVDATLETAHLNYPGSAITVGLYLVTQNGDGKQGCNLTGATTLVVHVASSDASIATVSPSQITWSSCGDQPSLTVTPTGIGSATISLTQVSNNSGGSFDLSPASFTASVTAPPVTNHNPNDPSNLRISTGSSPNNTGAFTLAWDAASPVDPDGGDTVTYTLQHKDANDAAYSDVATGLTTTSHSFTNEPEGTWSYRVEAVDSHNSTSNWDEQTGLVKVDESNPSAPLGNTNPAAAYSDGTYNWYKDSATVSFTGNGDPALADASAGSGVASVTASQTFDSTAVNPTTGYFTITGTATDNAGNVSSGTSVEGKVDWQSPTVSITPSTPYVYTDGSGHHWWKGSFSYDVSASDPAPSSGFASGGDPTTAGVGPATTSGTVAASAYTATDNVGHDGSNSAFAYYVDATAPNVDCTVPDTTTWYGSDQTVTCTTSDADSGLANSTDASFSLSTNVSDGTETSTASTGSKTVTDNVGNSTTVGPYTFMIDRRAPQLTGCDTPDSAWHAGNVTLYCTYTDGGSGPATQTVPLATSVANGVETANAAASAGTSQACDTVSNCAASPGDIDGNMIDRKAPVITDNNTTDSPTGMVLGTYWYNHDVTVNFSATDGGSGLASTCPSSWTAKTSGEGTGVTASSGPCSDMVGNTNSGIHSSGYNVDKTAPTVTCGTGLTFLLNQADAQVSATVSDTGSGPAATTASSTADTSSPGTHTVEVDGFDNAGNIGVNYCSYTVNYGLGNGFLPPLNPDTTGSVLNIGNAGRTYPIKWQLRDANGNYVTNAVSGTTISVSKVACTTFSSDTGDLIDTTTSGATVLRYDTTSNQYIYNWATPTNKSTCYRMTVSLPSGQKMLAAFQMK